MMTLNALCPYTFTALRSRLGLGRKPQPLVTQMRSNASDFCRSLVATGLLSEEQLHRAADRYRLGMNRTGGVIFWQIDEHDELREGKLMYYGADCHRDHARHPTWVSHVLKRLGQLPTDYEPVRCLFGLHLLKDDTRSVAVVESEKTAVILSERMPEQLWLASGGLNMLSAEKLLPLCGRKVVLFPDTDPDGKAYAAWQHVAEEASEQLHQPIHVSRLLEEHATAEQKSAKIDIADFLFAPP